jgi:uncharacterized membrane protein
MTLAPALTAPFAIQLHLLTVLPAFVIGLWLILFSTKGKMAHRTFGWIYLVLMTVTAITTLFIHSSGAPGLFGFSFIHLFVPLTLYGVVGGLIAARKHDMPGHRRAMLGMFIGAMVIAGALTFLPGRIMNQIVTGG